MGRSSSSTSWQQSVRMMLPVLNLLLVLPSTLSIELPYIRLRDNPDEPEQLGFWLDLQGHGAGVLFTDMQAHSLKPTGGTDMQFNITENQIQGFGDADGHCVAARNLHVNSVLDCPPCDHSDALQRWVILDEEGGSILLEASTLVPPRLCLTVGQDLIQAGPFFKRHLFVTLCDMVDPKFKTWDVVN